MSPSVPPTVLQREEIEQQQLPQTQQQPQGPMIGRMLLNVPMRQRPPVQHVDNFRDFVTHQSLLNQSAVINPTFIMSDSTSMGQISQSSASSMNLAPNIPLTRNFNHEVNQLPADQLANGLIQGVPREPPAMHLNARIRRNQNRQPLTRNFNHEVNQLPADQLANGPSELPAMRLNARIRRNQYRQFAVHLRARRQVRDSQAQLAIANYGLLAENWNLRMEKKRLIKYLQLLEDIIVAEL